MPDINLTFYRQNHTNLVMTFLFDEPLGGSVGTRFRNYIGQLGTLTLYHVGLGAGIDVVPAEYLAGQGSTPDIPADEFVTSLPLAGLPDGEYEVRGSVQDSLGNITILTAVQFPGGGETVIDVRFTIVAGSPFAIHQITIPAEGREIVVPSEYREVTIHP